MIYTNFSFEGRTDEGKGYVRYENAKKIFKEMRNEGFTPQRIFQQASRSFYNSLLDIDLMDKGQSPNNRTGWFVEQDFIPRLESTASIVIQGVKSVSYTHLVRIACHCSEWIGKLLKKSMTLNSDKYIILKQRNWICDVTPLQDDLGFIPAYPLRKGLEESIEWYKKEGWL